jgi:hypothetical protein
MKIQGRHDRAIRYGPRVQDHQKHALHPARPTRASVICWAPASFHTAKNDAGYREALNTLLAAEKLFARGGETPAQAPRPALGMSSCLTKRHRHRLGARRIVGGHLAGPGRLLRHHPREERRRSAAKLNVLKERGYTFDLGPSILTLPHIFERLFERSGRKMSDYIPIRPLRPHWRNFFEDGKVVDLYPDPERMAAEARKVGEDPENVSGS